ncbi:MAG: 4-hydroxy-tetrahydrodipicolinate synthase, partial [Gammaproteobacteria bacterium]|nr:4-hydroxy-tetrahydrodipicolinate synthase [Gammaproteobacteria bacterium]
MNIQIYVSVIEVIRVNYTHIKALQRFLRWHWVASNIAALLTNGPHEIMFTGSLVALVTPMSDDGQIDYACLAELIEWHIEQGTDGIVVAGTTGESTTLSKKEHAELIRKVAELVARRIPVIAGTGSNSTQQTIELSLEVADSTIDGYLMVTPYYNKPTQVGLYEHYKAIGDAVSKPVMLYNVPGRTAVDLLPETVARLAGHPMISGLKEATGDVERVTRIRELCGDGLGLYSGDDATS